MLPHMQRERLLMSLYHAMREQLGPSYWWPGDTPFEVAVGAVLTQNTNWSNVEKAIANLKARNALTPETMRAMPHEALANCIRPSGYYNIKATRLKNLLHWLFTAYQGDMEALKNTGMETVRTGLLSVTGIGPETADAITLYAAEHPTFVVDAYTLRMFSRHGLVADNTPYEILRMYFMEALPKDVALYGEYHALIVRVAKEWCRKKAPLCSSCPLNFHLKTGQLPEGAR